VTHWPIATFCGSDMQGGAKAVSHHQVSSLKRIKTSNEQCDSSYGFSVIVRVTVTDFIIFQLEFQLQLTNKMFFSYSYG